MFRSIFAMALAVGLAGCVAKPEGSSSSSLSPSSVPALSSSRPSSRSSLSSLASSSSIPKSSSQSVSSSSRGVISSSSVKPSSSGGASSSAGDALKAGRDIWEGQCLGCHGATGQGGAGYNKPIKLDTKTNQQWITYIYDEMPPGSTAVSRAACDLNCAKSVFDFMKAGYPGAGEVLACEGSVEDHTNLPIRSLTTRQYRNLLSDVFAPVGLNFGTLIPGRIMQDTEVGGFSNNSAVTVNDNNMADLLTVAEKVAGEIVTKFNTLMTCGNNEACARQFVEQYGARLFREAPTTQQITDLINLYKTGASPNEGLKYLVTALLIAPQTVYHDEKNITVDRKLLSGREIAERLSFLIWDSPPDAAMLAKADNNQLATEAGIAMAVNEMLADPRSLRGLRVFYEGYFHYSNLTFKGAVKDTARGIDFPLTVPQALDDVTLFAHYLTVGKKGTFNDLLTSNKAIVSNVTAPIYGISTATQNAAPAYSAGTQVLGKEVTLDKNQRSGILTRIGFVIHGGGLAAGLASPTDRGIAVREEILCQTLPNAPGDVEFPSLPDPKNTTWVEVVKTVHLKGDNFCTDCHKPMDPVGFAFENYTLNGQFIDTYPNGKPVDASGNFEPIVDQPIDLDDQVFSTPQQLSELIARSPAAQACFAKKWATFALMRDTANKQDICALEKAVSDFKAKNYSLSELIVAVATNPAFRFRNKE